MATVQEIQELYDLGKIAEAMAAVWAETHGERRSSDPEIGQLRVIRAWCHWRRQEWGDALMWLEAAEEAGGAELKAKRLRAYFAAYRDKDDEILRAIAQELNDDVGVQNALIIRARDPDSSAVSLDEVRWILERFSGSIEVDVANLYHNAARLFLAKGSIENHFFSALVLIDGAIARYGLNMHWHHRAAAAFWRSHILARLNEKEEARDAIIASVLLWEAAVQLDPANQGFRTNLENAQKREVELREQS